LPVSSGASSVKQESDSLGPLGNVYFNAAADTFQQSGDIQKVIRRGQADFVRELIEIRRKREDAFAREARQQQDGGGSKIERQIVEDAVGFVGRTHQLIEAFRRAGKHVREIPDVEANALRLAGSSGS